MKKALVCLMTAGVLAMSACASTSAPAESAAPASQAPASAAPAPAAAPASEAPAPAAEAPAETAAEGASNLTPNGEFPIVNEKVTLKFFAPQVATVEDITTNEYTLWYEEKTNVHIEWDTVPENSVNEKRALILASGDYPDVLFSAGVTKNEEIIYGQQGVFAPLNDLIEQYGPETKIMFGEVSGLQDQITAPDGNIYSLPQLNEAYHTYMPTKQWVNQKWLDALNLEVPKTTEEYEAMLIAFRDNDPNGNGIQDEIPSSGGVLGSTTINVDGFLLNSFVYNDNINRLTMENDVVDTFANKEEFRDGLRYINSLYEQGLIDPVAFTQDRTQLREQMVNPDADIVGTFPGAWFGHIIPVDAPQAVYFEPIPPLLGPGGVQTTTYAPFGYTTGRFVITQACTMPEVAMRWADYLYTEESTFATGYGREGKEWQYVQEDKVGIDGEPAVWERLGAQGTTDNYYWHQMGTGKRTNKFRLSEAAAPDPYSPQGYETRLYLATKLYEPHVPAQVYPPVYMTAEQSSDLAQIQVAFQDYVKESIARFCTGDMDLDADWEEYLSNLESLGVSEYVAIYQAAYDAQYK